MNIEEKYGQTLKEWDRRVSRAVEAHYESAKKLREKHYKLGIIALIMVTLIGALKDVEVADNYKMIFSSFYFFISVAAAILVGLQTFLNYGKRAEIHKETASNYGSIRRQIEHLAIQTFPTEAALEKCVKKINGKLDSLSSSSIEVPAKVWTRVRKKYDRSTFKSKLFT